MSGTYTEAQVKTAATVAAKLAALDPIDQWAAALLLDGYIKGASSSQLKAKDSAKQVKAKDSAKQVKA